MGSNSFKGIRRGRAADGAGAGGREELGMENNEPGTLLKGRLRRAPV